MAAPACLLGRRALLAGPEAAASRLRGRRGQPAWSGRALRDDSAATTSNTSSPRNWLRGSNGVPAPSVNRSLKQLRNSGQRLVERRLLAFVSAVLLFTLAWYGQDVVAQIGGVTHLPVEEVDGIIYFVVGYLAVSFVVDGRR